MDANEIIKVNGVYMPSGESVTYSLVVMTKNENTLESGDLTYDYVTKKIKVTIDYSEIRGNELIAILGKSWFMNQGDSNYTYSCEVLMPDDSKVNGNFYFTTSDIKLDVWDNDKNGRIYSGFSITWIQK